MRNKKEKSLKKRIDNIIDNITEDSKAVIGFCFVIMFIVLFMYMESVEYNTFSYSRSRNYGALFGVLLYFNVVQTIMFVLRVCGKIGSQKDYDKRFTLFCITFLIPAVVISLFGYNYLYVQTGRNGEKFETILDILTWLAFGYTLIIAGLEHYIEKRQKYRSAKNKEMAEGLPYFVQYYDKSANYENEKVIADIKKMISGKDLIIEKVADQIDEIRAQVNQDKIKYSVPFEKLGMFSPSLLAGVIGESFKKGELQETKPKFKYKHKEVDGDEHSYMKCFFDINGEIMYFEKHNRFDQYHTYYFLREENNTFVVPFIDSGKIYYPSGNIYLMTYNNDGDIEEYTIITSYNAEHEKYSYGTENNTVCASYIYNPSSRKNKLSELRSEISMQDGEVTKVRCYEMKKGKWKLKTRYEKQQDNDDTVNVQ